MNKPLLALIVMKSACVDELKKFYETIGLQFMQEQHGTGPVHYSANFGDTIFEIYPVGSGEYPDKTRLGLYVHNFDEVCARLKSIYALAHSQPRLLRGKEQLVVKDPEGRKVELYKY